MAENRLEEAALDIKYLLEQGYTYTVIVEGSQTEVGESPCVIVEFHLFDPNNVEVTDQYDITYETGILRVMEQQKITVDLYEVEKRYDGTLLEYGPKQFYNIQGISLDEYDVEISISGGITDAGILMLHDVEYTFTVIRKADGVDVSSDYYVSFNGTPLTVSRRKITLMAASEEKPYDGVPLKNGDVYISYGELINGHKLTAKAIGSITDEGWVYNVVDPGSVKVVDSKGNDVTDNYEFSFIDGKLTVTDDE